MARGSDLTADCGRCAGLCCMAFAFDRSESFAIDKPAGDACPHLAGDFTCRIHAERADRGFAGCIGFDCQGSGQRVVEGLFPGQDWRTNDETRRRMIEAFRPMREVHRLLELLHLAGGLPLPWDRENERLALIEALDPDEGWTEAGLRGFEDGPLPRRVDDFLGGLRRLARRGAPA